MRQQVGGMVELQWNKENKQTAMWIGTASYTENVYKRIKEKLLLRVLFLFQTLKMIKVLSLRSRALICLFLSTCYHPPGHVMPLGICHLFLTLGRFPRTLHEKEDNSQAPGLLNTATLSVYMCTKKRAVVYAVDSFFCLYIASSKHERGWENSWQLSKPQTKSTVCLREFSQIPKWLGEVGYINTEKVFYCFYNIILKNARES